MLCLKIYSIIFPSALHTTYQNSGGCEFLQGNQEQERSLFISYLFAKNAWNNIFSHAGEIKKA